MNYPTLLPPPPVNVGCRGPNPAPIRAPCSSRFAQNLRHLLCCKGYTYADLSALLPGGYSPRKLRRYVYGDQLPKLNQVEELAEVLQVHPGDLAWGDLTRPLR